MQEFIPLTNDYKYREKVYSAIFWGRPIANEQHEHSVQPIASDCDSRCDRTASKRLLREQSEVLQNAFEICERC